MASSRIEAAGDGVGGRPVAADRARLERTQIFGLVFYHAVAALAFLPWFFSGTGVVLAVLGIYVSGCSASISATTGC